MKKGKRVLALFLALLLTACASQREIPNDQPQQEAQITGFTASYPGAYDSVDTAIVVKKDAEARTISLRNLETGRQYTLTYDGITALSDKNDQVISMAQVQIGDLVDVTFLKNRKTLTSLQLSPNAFNYQSVTDFKISESGRSITINGTRYRLADDLAVVSEGKIGSLMDINSVDTLAIKGFDFEVHSIVIDRGHGYLRLSNDESFIGGWIEVGSKLIVPIQENMLLTVPEGTYDVSVSCGGSGGTKQITIYRNAEQTMDVGDLVTEIKEGSVLFDVMPSSASVYVDGEKIDSSQAVTLTYGIHQVILRAEGYVTLTKYIRVGQAMATLTMEMERDTSANDGDNNTSENGNNEDNSQGGNSGTSGNTPTPTATPTPGGNTSGGNMAGESSGGETSGGAATGNGEGSGEGPSDDEIVSPSDGTSYYIVINAPQDAEVYVDGTYLGLAPVRFLKVEGTHVVTLRKSGYQTRSYTIEADDQQKDVTYSFSELQPLN